MELNKTYIGDALEVLKTFPNESIDCVVTSPPYWALRDYGADGQLGLEPTFDEYIKKLCDIFDEVKRVLKSTGTCFVNIGDTYSSVRYGNDPGTSGRRNRTETPIMKKEIELAEKSLCQIPSRFAIEMTNRGWILRNEIIWHKPNSMPSSAKDRFTVDFEKMFFFVKNQKYYFDTQYEPWTGLRKSDIERAKAKHQGYQGKNADGKQSQGIKGQPVGDPEKGRIKRTVWSISTQAFNDTHFAVFPELLVKTPVLAGSPTGGVVLDPFAGSGTTLYVARLLDRKYVGIDINPKYLEIINRRVKPDLFSI